MTALNEVFLEVHDGTDSEADVVEDVGDYKVGKVDSQVLDHGHVPGVGLLIQTHEVLTLEDFSSFTTVLEQSLSWQDCHSSYVEL